MCVSENLRIDALAGRHDESTAASSCSGALIFAMLAKSF